MYTIQLGDKLQLIQNSHKVCNFLVPRVKNRVEDKEVGQVITVRRWVDEKVILVVSEKGDVIWSNEPDNLGPGEFLMKYCGLED
jgi:hypothetical protein